MYFEEIILENGKRKEAAILPEIEINLEENKFHLFIAYFIPFTNVAVKDDDKPRIAREILKGTFKFSPDYKTIEINNTKYDVADFYNKTMIAKNDEKTVSMIVLHLLYDKSWKEIIEYAALKGLKRK